MNPEQNSKLLKKYIVIMNTCSSQRKLSKWSQDEMSKILHISKSSLSDYENCKTIDFIFLETYAKMFGINVMLFY